MKKIAVIDSGVNMQYSDFKYADFELINLTDTDIAYDISGHGTSCCGEIIKYNTNVEFVIIKILNENNKGSLDKLIKALDYCAQRDDLLVVNISISWIISDSDINYICRELIKKIILKGTIVVSAYHNDISQVLSYPAEYHEVLGVRHHYDSVDRIVYDSLKNDCVFWGSFNLMPYKDNEYRIFKGNSCFSARLAGILYSALKQNTSLSIEEIIHKFNTQNDKHNWRKGEKPCLLRDELLNYLGYLNFGKSRAEPELFFSSIKEKECMDLLLMIERDKHISFDFKVFTSEDFMNIDLFLMKINRGWKNESD